jgi:hypothetical protein
VDIACANCEEEWLRMGFHFSAVSHRLEKGAGTKSLLYSQIVELFITPTLWHQPYRIYRYGYRVTGLNAVTTHQHIAKRRKKLHEYARHKRQDYFNPCQHPLGRATIPNSFRPYHQSPCGSASARARTHTHTHIHTHIHTVSRYTRRNTQNHICRQLRSSLSIVLLRNIKPMERARCPVNWPAAVGSDGDVCSRGDS